MEQDLAGVFLHMSLTIWVSVREGSLGRKPRHCKDCGLCCQASSRKVLLSFHFYQQCWERQNGIRIHFHPRDCCLFWGFSLSLSQWKHACPLDVSYWTAANYLMSVRVFLVTGTHDLPSSCLVRCRRTRGRPWKFPRAVPWEMVWSKPRGNSHWSGVFLSHTWKPLAMARSHIPWTQYAGWDFYPGWGNRPSFITSGTSNPWFQPTLQGIYYFTLFIDEVIKFFLPKGLAQY